MLTFSKIHTEDSGEYLCRAANQISYHDSTYVSIRVSYPPKNTVIEVDPPGEVHEGTKVTMTCMSEADPPAHTYTWIKKSGDVQLELGKEKILTFSKIRPEDRGEYLCRTANEIGQQDSPGFFFQSGNTIQLHAGYQNTNSNVAQPDDVYQSLNPNTTQPDAVYQSLNPNTIQPDAVYYSLIPNTTQPDAVYQSLNPNTMQHDAVY
ncbi:hypothetical protein ACEWY4_017344 [Coilia grayii]|uniref:Ig-like domain-containing protein n=1 Tax=Coilia grayii TaxID=363190 RepID=A0ABD1JGK1_9TELE